MGDWGIINIQLAKKECFNLAIIVEYRKYNVFFHHREMMKEALTQVLQQVTEKTKQKKQQQKFKSDLFIYSFSSWRVTLYQSHLHTISPKADLFFLFYACTPLVCLLLLLMAFFFCITRTNLIRAEGIQIRVHPPIAIWSSNKERGEGKQRITNAFQELERELLEVCESFNKWILQIGFINLKEYPSMHP